MTTLSAFLNGTYSGFTGSQGFTGSIGFTGSVGFTGSAGTGGATLSDNTSTNANTFYPAMANNQVSGSMTSAVVSSTKLYYNPSTGTLNATVFNSLSDYEKKKDITIIVEALNLLSKINGVRFRWRDNDKPSAGVIAQELKVVMPELVEDDWSVNYSGIIALLIESIKTLESRVKILESKIDI